MTFLPDITVNQNAKTKLTALISQVDKLQEFISDVIQLHTHHVKLFEIFEKYKDRTMTLNTTQPHKMVATVKWLLGEPRVYLY